ncbi:MAG: thioredoxin domain-containing protein [bacterium]|nr:thioredoxin domain-containing protein [bacterium]
MPRSRHRDPDGSPLYTNRLLLEKSPYLQQHAHNPVNWFPWGPEAFAEARRLDRPVLVSIGYATCHWCHVMEEESFDSVEVAELMNSRFVAIKVDREARPDIDAIYLGALHAMGQRGGWPLNVFMTPEGEPFYGGTYFPPQDGGGRPSFSLVLSEISKNYSENRVEIEQNASLLAAHLKRILEGHVGTESALLGEDSLASAIGHFARVADREWGGVGSGTKFPSSLPIGLLLRESRRTGDEDPLALVKLTLDRMAAGGIHDHLAGGFHRYATDPRWLVPHFEKMLYDNALIAVAYLEAYQATGDARYASVLRGVLDYVLREMTDSGGGFYSATDADSLTPGGESEEGYFFTWTLEEVRSLLGAKGARVPAVFYGLLERGPLEGRNVLHIERSPREAAASLGLTRAAFDLELASARSRLLTARRDRPAPIRDEKILVAWNGLMISAFARASFALDEPRYLTAAVDAADFILGSMLREDRLHRVSLAGEAAGPAFLEDYGFLIAAFIDLYEASGDPRWVESAIRFQAVQEAHYADAVGGGYFRTADDGERLLAREKPISDGALPSGNSVAAANLSKLSAFTGEGAYLERLGLLYSAFADHLERTPSASSELMEVVSDREAGLREVVLVEGPGGENLAAMLAPLRVAFAPNRVLVRTREGALLESLASTLSIVRGKRAIGAKTTAYVCENRVCQFPTNDPAKFREQLLALPAMDEPLAAP